MSRSVLGNINLPRELGPLIPRLYDLFRATDRELAKRAYRGEATWNPASIADGDNATTTVTVMDAQVGDAVHVFPPYTLSGLGVSGYVSADNVVTIVLNNNTGGAVDFAEGAWRVSVEKW